MTEASPLLSVAMITYNHGKYIRQALDSILMQKVNFDYEVIVGEDCSPDDTRQIVTEYAEKYPGKIKLILQKYNKGPNENFKDVVRQCCGEYIALLEGDDYWTDPDKLQIQIDYMEKHSEVSCTYHKVSVINEENEIIDHEYNQKHQNVHDLNQLFQQGFLPTCSIIIKNYFIDNHYYLKYFKSKYVGDLLLHSLSLKHGQIHYLDQNMGVRRLVRKEGTSFNALSDVIRRKYNVIAFIAITELLDKDKDKEFRKQFIAKWIISNMLWLYYEHQRKVVLQICIRYLNLYEKMLFAKYLKDIRYLMKKDVNSTKCDALMYFALLNAINTNMMQNLIRGDDKVIIYGTKDWGRRLYHVLPMKRMNTLAFSDSKEEMWDQYLYGLRIIPPMEIKNTDYARILIASSAYVEIQESLRHMGIDEKRIIFFEFMRG